MKLLKIIEVIKFVYNFFVKKNFYEDYKNQNILKILY